MNCDRSADEIAHAFSGLVTADGCPLPGGHPLAPLAWGIACSVTAAGLTVHHCARHDPLCPLGGVCLLPVQAGHGAGPAGICVSWTTHDRLLLDEGRYGAYSGTLGAMNSALGAIMRAFGYDIRPFGSGGAWLVTGHQQPGQRSHNW